MEQEVTTKGRFWRGSEWHFIEGRHINARVCRGTIRSHEEVLHGEIGLIVLSQKAVTLRLLLQRSFIFGED